MSSSEVLAAAQSVSKHFGATRALHDVSVEFRAGEVHALVGENGAGKSTLGKILVGIHIPDNGNLVVAGTPTSFSGPAEAVRAGFVGVAQELSLVPAMSVTDNVMLGTERGPFVDDRGARRRVQELTGTHGFDLDPDARVRDLSVADQQKVEILRALGRDLRLVVFDEPTARLASHEAMELRRTVRNLSESGVAVVFVSHFLDEVLAVADRITIMRDGEVVRTSLAADESHQSLVEAMTGKRTGQMFPELIPPPVDAPDILRVEGLSYPGQFQDVNLHVRSGEILGLAGLVGAGRSELAHAIYGATRAVSGRVFIGDTAHPGGVAAGIRCGVALIPESRRHQGLILRRSVVDNVTLPLLDRFRTAFGLAGKKATAAAEAICVQAGVKAASMTINVESLSGGNQQKVLFGRALLAAPKLLIADEPTRGVDVGAKQSIYELIARLAADGCAVLLISSEIEEVLGLSHRVAVMRGGRLVAEFGGADKTETNVLNAAFADERQLDPPKSETV